MSCRLDEAVHCFTGLWVEPHLITDGLIRPFTPPEAEQSMKHEPNASGKQDYAALTPHPIRAKHGHRDPVLLRQNQDSVLSPGPTFNLNLRDFQSEARRSRRSDGLRVKAG